jgi:hypothetical protein
MKKSNQKTYIAVFGFGIIVIILLSLLSNPSLSQPASGGAAQSVRLPTTYPAFEVPRISVQDAKRLYDEGKAIVIDVRSQESYAESHIPGAVNYPLPPESVYVVDAPRDALLFLYCT